MVGCCALAGDWVRRPASLTGDPEATATAAAEDDDDGGGGGAEAIDGEAILAEGVFGFLPSPPEAAAGARLARAPRGVYLPVATAVAAGGATPLSDPGADRTRDEELSPFP